MKTINFLALVAVAIITISSCSNNQKNAEAFDKYQRDMGAQVDGVFENMQSADVAIIYFHSTRRCATCQAVEQVTKQTVDANFKDKVNFKSVNIEAEENKALVEKYKVTGQTLLIIKGAKTINLTNDAFMNARTKPEEFETKLKETIEQLF